MALISLISEHYNRRMTEAFNGISGIRHIVDNIIYESDITDHINNVERFLKQYAGNNIALNVEK